VGIFSKSSVGPGTKQCDKLLEVWRGTGRWMMGVPETGREAEERNGPVTATRAKTATSFSILEE
jgi:hypothetical protein